MRRLVITAVEVHLVSGPSPAPPPGGRQRQVNAIAGYDHRRPPRYTPERPATTGPASSRYVRIGTDAGVDGFYGPIDPEVVWPLLHQLRDVVLGQDALASSLVWDQLERSNRHARHGALKMAISAIDNALWDLRGKVFDAPVWQVLGGGPARPRIPAYASTLGTSLDLDVVRQTARDLRDEGFAGQKWFFGDGPADGAAGLANNVALARTVREAVGDEPDIMFDALGGFDLTHARAWAQRVEELTPRWLEEPFPPNRLPAFAELRAATSVPLATGEHLYDRADVLPYLSDGILAAVQADPEWCGGVTELVRICALAETFGVPVIPHGHGLHAALHVIAAQSPVVCPMAEYLVRIMPNRHHFELDPPAPVGGSFELPTEPGFGITLDESKIDSHTVLNFN